MAERNWKDGCWVATIFLVRPDGKVLLTWNKNLQTWIPVGGHIDPGERPDHAVKREVEEETGFDFVFANPIENDPSCIPCHHIQVDDVPHHNFHLNVVFFGRCTKWSDKPTTDEDEMLRWFSKDELVKEPMPENVRVNALSALQNVSFP